MRKLFSVIFLITILVIPFNSCKKAQFNELGNIITIKLPSSCSDCIVVMTQNEGFFTKGDYFDDHEYKFEFGHDDNTGTFIFNPYQNGISDEVTLNIDWNNMSINPHLFLTPHKEVIFYVLNTEEDAQGIYVSDYEENIAAINFEPGHEYYWDTPLGIYTDLTPDSTGNPLPSHGIVGKWMRTDKNCINENKEDDSFIFNSTSKGEHFLSDCSNQCSPFGIQFPFTYTIQDNNIHISYSNSYYYCSQIFQPPNATTTFSYKRVGDLMTIDGIEYSYQYQ